MSVGSRSLPPLWLPPHGVSVCGPYKVVFPSSLESILFGLVNFRFSLLQDVQGLWWLWPWPLIYFVFGLKLLKELALMKTFIRILWVCICLSLGIFSPTSLSHILLRWGLLHVLGFSSASLPPRPTWILLKTFHRMFCVILGKSGKSTQSVASSSQYPIPCQEERISFAWA